MKEIRQAAHNSIKQRVSKVLMKEVNRIDKAIRAALIAKGILK